MFDLPIFFSFAPLSFDERVGAVVAGQPSRWNSDFRFLSFCNFTTPLHLEHRWAVLMNIGLRAGRPRRTNPGSLGGHIPRPTATVLAEEIEKSLLTTGQSLLIRKECTRRKRDFSEAINKFARARGPNEADSGTSTRLRFAKDHATENIKRFQHDLRNAKADFTLTGI